MLPSQQGFSLPGGSTLPSYASTQGLAGQSGMWSLPSQQLPGGYFDEASLSMLPPGA